MARQDAGMSLVEAVISAGLLFVVTTLTYGSIVFMHGASRDGETRLREAAGWREALHHLRDELRMCTLERDPITNLSRFTITTGPSGRHVFTFRKIVGVEVARGEIGPQWSPEIQLTVDDDGHLVRTEAGVSRTIASGLHDLVFEALTGAFRVTTIVRTRDTRDGRTVDRRESLIIRPNL